MTWFPKTTVSYFQLAAMTLMKSGAIPKHVAIIMDGNRRYSSQKSMEYLQGYKEGFKKLTEICQWCIYLGIKELTVYAFSIENLKRTQTEVDELFQLAENKFQLLLDEKDKLMKYGIRIYVIGNESMVPKTINEITKKVVTLTKNNKRFIINFACFYTGRDEMTQTVKKICQSVNKKEEFVENLNEELFSNFLYTNELSDPDLLIRTSGEVRFSDFLLWQISYSNLYFTKTLWPEYTIWDFLKAIFFYQRSCATLLYQHNKQAQ